MSSETLADKLTSSVAPSASGPAPLGVPLRNIFLTLMLTISTLTASGYFWRETGYEMLIVTLGWPHVILGFVFYFGRVKRGEANARAAFLLLALLTVTIWIAHYHYAITGLIYLYFLYHAFRDEIFIYLQTRARHRPGINVYAVAGVGPLILLMLLVPKQQDFRQDLRRTEFTGEHISRGGWTLVRFKPITNSSGRDFYFQLQAPHTEGLRAFITKATESDSRPGEILLGDHPWPSAPPARPAKDLVFQPHYAGDAATMASEVSGQTGSLPVLLTGGHRVGQTFTAERHNLDGIWLPIDRFEQPGETTQLVFHLASPPLLPYSAPLANLRLVLLALLAAVVLWRLIPHGRQNSQLWIYLLVLAGAFAGTQMILKSSSNAGYPFPLIFQFVVVFHYWSWYVFSFDKLRPNEGQPNVTSVVGSYDRMLGYLRRAPFFALAVIVLNLISAAGVYWYYRGNGPLALRFALDYNYFLYILVFHVTFSFKPKIGFKSQV
jgi:hypothetical protein